MPIERSNVPGLAQPPGYTHLATVTEARLVFIAGQVPLNECGELVGRGDAIAQVRQCLGNLAGKLADHLVEDPAQRYLDGDAANLDTGTTLDAVKGYRPGFRLAARRDGDLVLFEAAENPRARTWGDLLDVGDKVRWIGVNDGSNRPLAAIRDRQQVARLVDLLLGSRVGNQVACADDGVFLAFHLDDATATTLANSVHFRRLDCRDPLPQVFGAAIRTALR